MSSLSLRQVVGTVVVGGSCGALAFVGEPSPAAAAKATIVGGVSAYIAFRALGALDEVNEANAAADEVYVDVVKRIVGTPSLISLETSAKLRGPSPSVPEMLARRLADSLSAGVSSARSVAGSAVYLGLLGTLFGLTFAVMGLRGLESDPERIKDQILTVVSGFGGSFACALTGIVATVWLSNRLGKFDALVLDIESQVETHLAERVLPVLGTSEEKLAALVAKAVSEGLERRLGGFWTPLVESSLSLSRSAASIEASTQRLENSSQSGQAAAESLKESAEAVTAAVLPLSEASDHLKGATSKIRPVLEGILAGNEGIRSTLHVLTPALEAAKALQGTLDQTERTLAGVDRSMRGITASVHDAAQAAGAENSRLISLQHQALREQVDSAYGELARAMNILSLLIDRADVLLRDLPVAAPATRIIEDLKAAGVEQAQAAQRDATTLRTASERLETTEQKIAAAIGEIRKAHSELSATLLQLERQTRDVRQNIVEVAEYVEQPFWKKLGGRKHVGAAKN